MAQTPPEFIANDVAGIFYYNTDEVIKEARIKSDDNKNKAIVALKDYNAKVKKTSFLNSLKLKELEVLVNRANKNFNSISDDEKINTRKKVQDVLVPVIDSIKSYEKVLNENFENLLSKKQNKRWLKLQKRKKKELLPEQKRPENNNPPPSMNRRNNRRF